MAVYGAATASYSGENCRYGLQEGEANKEKQQRWGGPGNGPGPPSWCNGVDNRQKVKNVYYYASMTPMVLVFPWNNSRRFENM